jgi:hypothetical protein
MEPRWRRPHTRPLGHVPRPFRGRPPCTPGCVERGRLDRPTLTPTLLRLTLTMEQLVLDRLVVGDDTEAVHRIYGRAVVTELLLSAYHSDAATPADPERGTQRRSLGDEPTDRADRSARGVALASGQERPVADGTQSVRRRTTASGGRPPPLPSLPPDRAEQ